MDTDVALVVGVIAGGLAFMSLVSAYSESEPPRMAALLGLVAGVMILFAVSQNPSGYSMGDVPGAFTRVFAKVMN